jgi:ubiquinone biosynthesis monooxygenase Coq6
MVGSTLAVSLAASPYTQHLKIALLESETISLDEKKPASPSTTSSPLPSLRVSSITPENAKEYRKHGVWSLLQRYCSFYDMYVWHTYNDSGRIHWSQSEYNAHNDADKHIDALGYIVENDVLQRALFQRLYDISATSTSNIHVIAPARVDRIGYSTRSTSGVSPEYPVVKLSDGRLIASKLLIGADGPSSIVKKFAHISSTGFDYNQRAVVANVRNDSNQASYAAYQRFLPSGPVASLPVGEHAEYSNIVWSTTPAHAQHLVSLSDEQFLQDLHNAFNAPSGSLWQNGGMPSMFESILPQQLQELLPILFPSQSHSSPTSSHGDKNKPPRAVEVIGKRASFPLKYVHAMNYIDARIALIGDSAHVIHPLAGQGVNLGLGDAFEFSRCISNAVQHGQDIGDMEVLKKYEWNRQLSNTQLMTGIDIIGRIFRINNGLLAAMRSGGLSLFDNIPWIKNNAAAKAMGL